MRLTSKQVAALRIAERFGRVKQQHGDQFDHQRPEVAHKATLWSLKERGLIVEATGPRYMPIYELTAAGRDELKQREN